jgi:methyl coenzyme M reductase alpha subunit
MQKKFSKKIFSIAIGKGAQIKNGQGIKKAKKMARKFSTFNFTKKTNYYTLLGLEQEATKEEIKKQFRTMSKNSKI